MQTLPGLVAKWSTSQCKRSCLIVDLVESSTLSSCHCVSRFGQLSHSVLSPRLYPRGTRPCILQHFTHQKTNLCFTHGSFRQTLKHKPANPGEGTYWHRTVSSTPDRDLLGDKMSVSLPLLPHKPSRYFSPNGHRQLWIEKQECYA